MNRAASSPYQEVLGPTFDRLPPEVRAFHAGGEPRQWVGTCDIRRGRGPAAGLVASLFGFPPAGTGIPLSVTVTPDPQGETWTRDFGGHRLRSVQWAGTSGGERLLFERFGPVSVGSTLSIAGDRLRIVPRRGSILGLPIPAWLLPSGEVFETGEAGRFAFDVTINVPLAGLVVAYRGRMSSGPRDDTPA